MSGNLVVRGARVVDGTGTPAYSADVEVENGVITHIGRARLSKGSQVIDADGLTVVPAFIDVHTHFDAQFHFEPTASPSSWHGVTTAVQGNCGFSLAPVEPSEREWLSLMLAKVEGMSPAALAAGVNFDGGRLATTWGRWMAVWASTLPAT
jgi:N-acyl-D-amino-acid deacylase